MSTIEPPRDPEGTREAPAVGVDRWGPPRVDARPQKASFVGMAGMAMVAFLILASGTVVPWWGIVLLSVAWVAALVQGTRWFMRHPGRVAGLALGMLALWLAVLMGGALLLDWGR